MHGCVAQQHLHAIDRVKWDVLIISTWLLGCQEFDGTFLHWSDQPDWCPTLALTMPTHDQCFHTFNTKCQQMTGFSTGVWSFGALWLIHFKKFAQCTQPSSVALFVQKWVPSHNCRSFHWDWNTLCFVTTCRKVDETELRVSTNGTSFKLRTPEKLWGNGGCVPSTTVSSPKATSHCQQPVECFSVKSHKKRTHVLWMSCVATDSLTVDCQLMTMLCEFPSAVVGGVVVVVSTQRKLGGSKSPWLNCPCCFLLLIKKKIQTENYDKQFKFDSNISYSYQSCRNVKLNT